VRDGSARDRYFAATVGPGCGPEGKGL